MLKPYMIPQTPTVLPNQSWQQQLANAIKDPMLLLQQVGLENRLEVVDRTVLEQFPLLVSQSYINKMRYGDPTDPLLRQVFPFIDEAIEHPDFIADPVGDKQAITQDGILQKYQGRALLLTTGACAIHCRYCFRRHFPYQESNPLASHWPQTLSRLQQDTQIEEVILSGGDPLTLSDSKLRRLIEAISDIAHIKRVRIHTRLPVVLPDRVTPDLLTTLMESRLDVAFVIHANHSNELVDDVEIALRALQNAQITLLNQTVLLKGINDCAATLKQLSERLFSLGVLPYYLHLLDPVSGASHYDVPETQGIALIEQLRTELSGYLVPRLVREQQGEKSKTIIC